MRPGVSLILGLALVGAAAPVLGHSELLRATPAPGSVVTTSPSEVRVELDDDIVSGSGLEVVAASGGRHVLIGRVQVLERAMVAAIADPLAPGLYRVNWRVVSVDSHETQGSFTFEVRK